MKCPFELPVKKSLTHVNEAGAKYQVQIVKGKRALAAYLTKDEADYIVQAINSYEKLVDENRALKEQPRCPCGGELEGLGYDVKTKDVVYECKKCQSQIIIEQTLKEAGEQK